MKLIDFEMKSLPELCRFDRGRIALAKERQTAVWAHRRPDKWPAFFGGRLEADQEKIPAPNLKEAFYDSDLMLCSQIRGAIALANGRSDAVPSIRANMGTGTLLSCLGLEQEIFEDKMPWLAAHLTKGQASKLTPDDIRIRGTFERGLGHMRRYKEVMGDSIGIFCMDTQGPFDLAHLLVGDDIFYQVYDDPPYVHHLMEICLELGIRAHTWMKELSGERMDHCYHSDIYSESFGIRICEDTTAIVGDETIREFAMPYTKRLAAHFGGAWVHYCGRSDLLTRALCEIPEIVGVNFGLMPGGKQAHDFEQDMALFQKFDKVYVGAWPKLEKESGKEYLARMHSMASRGILIPHLQEALYGHEPFKDVGEMAEFWYGL